MRMGSAKAAGEFPVLCRDQEGLYAKSLYWHDRIGHHGVCLRSISISEPDASCHKALLSPLPPTPMV